MSYSVTCPSCHERNIGSAFHCVKCNTNLIGIPRQEDPISELGTSSQQKVTAKSPTVLHKEDKSSVVETVPCALWHTFRDSLMISLMAMVITALICWSLNKRTLYDFGDSLFYTSVSLAIIGWYIFNGNRRLARSQMNPLNPMNRAMPGTFSERTRQHWLDYLEGMTSVSVIGVAAALCFGVGWLIVSFVR